MKISKAEREQKQIKYGRKKREDVKKYMNKNKNEPVWMSIINGVFKKI